ncbi:MAG: ATP-binding protein [Bacteriovorax sp.]|nr:ATP-binding protein [Bacteriovorax sp.]
MKKISSFLEHKKSIAGLFLLAALVANTYNIQENSGRIKRLTNFESGMQTCFSRVNQTYTAKMLGDSASNYLTQNFQNLTEECFAEGILNVEDSFKAELSQVAKKLSTLASNVHWFHEDILSPGSVRTIANSGESRDIGVRFEKIETTKDEILESSEKYKAEISNSLNTEKTLFYVSATLLVLLMFSEYMSNTRRRLSNNIREKEAEAELLDNGGATSVKAGEIIKSALEQNNLINCSKLFANYHEHQSFDKNIKNKNKLSLEGLITPIGTQAPVELNEKIDKIWNDDSIGVTADNIEGKMLHDLNLEVLSSSVIDLLAEKLFSRGIQLDVKIPDNLMVKGRPEELEQTLYHLINYAINSTHEGAGEKNISIFAHRLGDIVAFDLIHSGVGFDEEILKHRVGITSSGKSLDVDLQICQSLLEEIEARFQLDNKLNQNGEIIGGRVKIIFKTGANATARLVDLKVGSKKEIQAILNQTAIN